MGTIHAILFFLVAGLLALAVRASEVEPLPPTNFASTIDSPELLTNLQQSGLFSQLDERQVGSPFLLTATYRYQSSTVASGAAVTSVLLSSATLGVVPMVANRDLIVEYDLSLMGEPLLTARYSRNFTDVVSIYGDNNLWKPSAEALVWVLSTAEEFKRAVADSERLKVLREEYRRYFGP